MFKRILQLSKKHSLFLFGARGTGKSTLLDVLFLRKNTLWIDLLDLTQEDELSRNPQHLESRVLALPSSIKHIIIDEIQKVPRLLDVIHRLSSQTNKQFIMTGSSAKKLRHGAANLLAGRAFVYHLFPLTFIELGDIFSLKNALQYGMLPGIYHLRTSQEKEQFLTAYALTYLREEILAEQLVKKLDPFRKFLEVAAQMSGKIINYAQISRDVGVDDKTIAHYFSLIEGTLLGFFIEPFAYSFRKRLAQKPKFYFIDVGITRALSRTLTLPTSSKTSYYGDIFEQFIIAEIYKLLSYYKPEYRLSFLKTKDDLEIDLVVDRPGKPLCLIEIKSTQKIREDHVSTLDRIATEFKAEAVCLSNDVQAKKFGSVLALHWQKGIKKLLE